MIRSFILIFSSWLLIPGHLSAQTLHVAIASNFIKPAKAIIDAFERETGHKVIASYGSSGKLYAQIYHGAPYLVFLSADQDKVNKLIEHKLAIENSQTTYAIGQLVLWSNSPAYKGQEFRRFTSGKFKRLAIANPKLAPYGLAAHEFISLHGITKEKIVVGENINQAYQFVASGNAELGFIAKSQLNASDNGWLVPQSEYSAIKQDMVLLKRGNTHQVAKQFYAFVRSELSKKIIAASGYRLPQGQ